MKEKSKNSERIEKFLLLLYLGVLLLSPFIFIVLTIMKLNGVELGYYIDNLVYYPSLCIGIFPTIYIILLLGFKMKEFLGGKRSLN